ncbi:putative mitochondrial AAA [Rosellinia necatrix]|uniref:Putative mitochondrial AAA n=1 Tax=Rosellinia necatrix TaxID=77044 RepID=A0A1S8AB00_ROSNE|nr:putative mitochondrial AAA [Rosellinia necatrix]
MLNYSSLDASQFGNLSQSDAVGRSIRAPTPRMSNQWLRAFQSAARTSRQGRLAIRTARPFHSSVPHRGPEDGGSAPRDDGGKPDTQAGASTGASAEASSGETETANPSENSLGETPAATNGESQGRRKPTGGLRSRALRNRKSDLPPVQIPESFLGLALTRHGKVKTSFKVGSTEQRQNGASEDIHPGTPWSFELRNDALFRVAAWSDEAVKEAADALNSHGDIDPIMKRMDMISASAYWTILHQVKEQYGNDAYAKILESTPPLRSLDWVTTLLKYHTENRPVVFQLPFIKLLLHHVIEDGAVPLTKAALFEPCIIDEITTALRADFFIRAPENSRPANLRRPATIINLPDCSGFSAARETLQHVAEQLGADILHLRAHDIAYIVGRYVGQDITRAPGDISLIGYRAAENCGRLKPRPSVEEEEEEDGSHDLPMTVTLHDETQKDTKRQSISMDDFLLGNITRGKSDELWEDMKVNAALDELIHSADVDTTEQRPLIIHINDFNALNMDETGATILSKIRKDVDQLWLSGRKIALVGSCSTSGAPRSYETALRALEMGERVIHLSKRYSPDAKVRVYCKSTLASWEKQDYLCENDENIVRMLWSMTESSDPTSAHSKGTLGLDKYASPSLRLPLSEQVAKYCDSVLSMAEIYRIATTMIGLSSTGIVELFSLECFEKAVAKTSAVDEAREGAAARSKASINFKRGLKGDMLTRTRNMDPYAENHEEKLMSGMVNAQDMRTTFKDIHAPPETIESIKMLTTLSLVRPEAFSYGVLASDRIPGCLLYGPPGTGKTLLAKAVAKESGANMIEISGASINNMYVGESEKNVRALFRLAKKKEPMVIFIDEADALLGARSGHQNGARRETINQFLREWDGMDKMKAFIMVATNRPFDLDEAVLRRLPRKLLIDLPLEADRAAILKIHLKDEAVDETVSIEDIAKRTPLYSGSDLKNMCVAAAMAAVKEELEASEKHGGPEPYKWAEKRVLNSRHFDKALKEIGASVSEDMATLTAIRKFDERYGDSKARKKRKGMGFEVVPEASDSEQALVRNRR